MEPLVDAVLVSSVNLGKKSIQVFDSETGSCIKNFRGPAAAPKSLCPVGSADYFICGEKDKPFLQAWAINQNDLLQMKFRVPGRLNVMAVSPSQNMYCAAAVGEKIYIYDLTSGCSFGRIERHYQDVTCLAFTSFGNYLASAGEDGFVYLWSRRSLEESLHKADRPQVDPHYVLGQHSDKVTGLCICGTGLRGLLITSSLDHSSKVFDLVTGHLRHNIIAPVGLTACETNSIGSQVFLAGQDGRVWGLNLLPHSDKQDLQVKSNGTVCHKSAIFHMALTTAGDTLVTGGVDGEVKVWSVVMADKKKMFGEPSLALQKTLLAGRGAISNILIRRLDQEIFNASTFKSPLVLSPFNADMDILEASISHSVPEQNIDPPSTETMFQLAANLLNNSEVKKTPNGKKHGKQNTVVRTEDEAAAAPDLEFLAYVKRLKKSNEDLYKFCLRHVLFDEEEDEGVDEPEYE